MKTFQVNYITNPTFGRIEGGNIGPQENTAANLVRHAILLNVANYNAKKQSRNVGIQILPPSIFLNTGAIIRSGTTIELFDIDDETFTLSVMAKMVLTGYSHLKYGFKCGFCMHR